MTIDSWSHLAINSKFFGVFATFVAKKSPLKSSSFLIGFVHSSESETAEYLKNTLKTLLDSLSIPLTKIICLVSDNGANMVSLAKIMKTPRVSCFAHVLDNAVKKSLHCCLASDNLMTQVKSLVAHFTQSNKATSTLASIQKTLGKEPSRIISYSETRWNSFFASLVSLVKNSDALEEYFKKLEKDVRGLTIGELSYLRSIFPVLELFDSFTEVAIGHEQCDNMLGPKRGNLFFRAISLIHDLVFSALSSLFEWYDEAKGDSKAFISANQPPDVKMARGFKALFALESAIRTRAQFFYGLMEDLKNDEEFISFEIASLGLIHGWNNVIQKESIVAEFEASLTDLPDPSPHTQSFLNLIKTLSSNKNPKTYEGLKRRTNQIEETDIEDCLSCLIQFDQDFYENLIMIDNLREVHKERIAKRFSTFGNCAPPAAPSPSKRPLILNLASKSIVNSSTNNGRTSSASSNTSKKPKSTSGKPTSGARGASRVPKRAGSTDNSEIFLYQSLWILESIPPTSVDIERCFSKATLAIDPLRNRLSEHKFAKEVLMSVNYSLMGKDEWEGAMKWRKSNSSFQSPTKPMSRSSSNTSFGSSSPLPNVGASQSKPTEENGNFEFSIDFQPQFGFLDPKGSLVDDRGVFTNFDDGENAVSERTTTQSLNPPPPKRTHSPAAPVSFPSSLPNWNSSTTDLDGQNSDKEDMAIMHIQKRTTQKDTPSSPRHSRSRENFIHQLMCVGSNRRFLNTTVANSTMFKQAVGKQIIEIFSQVASDEDFRMLVSVFYEILIDAEEDIPTCLKQSGDFLCVFKSSPAFDTENRGMKRKRQFRKVTVPFDKEKSWYNGSYPKTADELLKIFDKVGMVQQDVAGDGNCFFSSLVKVLKNIADMGSSSAEWDAQVLLRIPGNSEQARAEVVKYMRTKYTGWFAFLNKYDRRDGTTKITTEAGYCSKIAENGVWVSHPVVVAAASLYRLEIVVHTLMGPPMVQGPQDGVSSCVQVHMSNYADIHYMAVMPNH